MIFCDILVQKRIKYTLFSLVALLFSVTLGAQTLPTGEKTLLSAEETLPLSSGFRRGEEAPFGRNPILSDTLHSAANQSIDSLLVLPADTAGKRKERVTMDTKEILAYGKADTSAYGHTRPEFTEAGATYTMDTVTYNIDTKRAKIKGVVTKDGEGYLTGREVKLMDDQSFNIKGGVYTTCEHTDHPHFYISMSKAKFIPGKKIVSGPLFLVIADVPLPVMIPEIFFPMNTERKTGFIMPSYGEENLRGFYLKNGGYYFHINDYIDLKVTGGIYSLGSWEVNAASSYRVRYKYSGSLGFDYAKTISGDKGSADYQNSSNIKLTWTHSQDSKFNPNSTFSANVNFSTPGFNKNASNNLSEYLSAQTTSSISYSHSWKGTPMSLSANMNYSQNFNNGDVALGLPNVNFNVSRFYPFKRKVVVGKERWYEKISMTYKAQLQNTLNTKYEDMLKPETLDKFKNGIKHTLPISASFNILGFINLSPSVNYTERWYFRRVDQRWDPDQNTILQDTTRGFYRVYDYNASVSANTTLYGMYQFKNPKSFVKAIRHTINQDTPLLALLGRDVWRTKQWSQCECFALGRPDPRSQNCQR